MPALTPPPTSFARLIDCWETIAAFARDIGEPYENAKQWQRNDSIPARAFGAVVEAAREKGVQGVTHELLCGFAEDAHARRQQRSEAV